MKDKHQTTLNNVHLRTELKIFLYIISLLYESSIIIFFIIILLYLGKRFSMLYNLCACVFLRVVQAWYFRVENIYSAVSKRSIWIFECILPNHPSPSFTHCILGARDEMVLCLINLKLNEAAIRQHREYVESGQKKKEKHKSRMKAKEDKAGASTGVCKV